MPASPRRLLRPVVSVLAALATALCCAAATSASEPGSADIVSGSAVSSGEFASKWSFIVAIVNAEAGNQFQGQFCGGSLIDDQHVLTAAHCVTMGSDTVLTRNALRVVAKTRVLSTGSMGSGEQAARTVSEVFVHPDYIELEDGSMRADVAVLRLSAPIPGASTIPIVQGAESGLWGGGAGGINAFTAGWGDTDPLELGSPDLRYPVTLRQALIPLASDARCSSSTAGGYGIVFHRATSICGGTLQAGSVLGPDSCFGDSGGPLIVDAGDTTWRLAGTVSWGDGCGQQHLGVYSRLDALRGWIDSIPGATDLGAASGGPGGSRAVSNLTSVDDDYRHTRLDWGPPSSGTAPERYSVWLRRRIDGMLFEQLVGITPDTTYRALVPARSTADAFSWNVRPVLADGSHGPTRTIAAGPRADSVRPTRPGAPRALSRGLRSLTVRWAASRDLQSGLRRYEVQRRLPGRTGWSTAATTGGGSTTVMLGGLAPGSAIDVRVRAVDLAGNVSSWSPVRRLYTAPPR